ncbi:hypothetical protein GMB70_11555 [Turicibacter sanguinis]|uniref:helix-turn-helix domain-containing protein n=1 Tax=Turicibacter sanguinis TaxID=154288 RepID=UPI0012BD74B8|nr:helix-turn-helix domain-containing protein [Turicibacter sanguinis]MCU7195512.1 helix-turn-helix domain-containing protein [Turicibacter sanguinis]MTP79284.1 hypothetical protein [Turicibacter sanguinis]
MADKKENPIPIPQRFAVTYEEAGYLLGVSKDTILKLIKADLIEPLKLTKQTPRIRVDDLKALVDRMVGQELDTNELVLKPIEVYGI